MQHHWDFPRHINAVRVLLAVGQSHGLTVTQCLKNSDITLEDLSKIHHEINVQQEFQVLRNLIDLLGSEIPIGVEAGLRHHTTTFGAWGFAILSSPTIEAALHLALRYLQLSSFFCKLETSKVGEHTVITFNHDSLPQDLVYFLAERDYTTIMSLQKDILPLSLPVMEINVALPTPLYADRFVELTGYAINFDQPRSCIIIETRLLNLPLPQADHFTRTYYEKECQNLWIRRSTIGKFSQKIRNILLLKPSQMPNIEEIATQLEITVRMLQRHLASEGITYERLVSNIREDLAEDLLTTTELTIEEIAAQLGYSEASAFSRAFKRWKNVSPKYFRANSSQL
ncbi:MULTISPECIES: AraC family transcriptional regulator [unclassified Acinetobacter]|uniref:AraC family transcriptional regulator n=1 Tax=unclassified Acinetobacter TaxID=196816 RepID=UPI00124F4947|nr:MULTISPECIES: AraC family transcriptional regulator [unclassified Acinetobacter]